MGTSNSTRRSSGKHVAASGAGGSSRNQLSHQPEEILPIYRKPELQDFECVICKDLVYKPVVNACGHAFFCFWCAHESMGAGFQNSACPMCRSTFSHMPRVCELAHSYLTKVWPTEYAARAAEVEEEEKQRNMFSPEPIGLPQTAGKRRQVDALFRNGGGQVESAGATHAEVQATSAASKGSCGEEPAQADTTQATSTEMVREGSDENRVEEFTAGDCECLLCNKLLFQPVVLSCGHAYCFLCLEERFPVGRVVCAYCQKAHLEDEVTVCGQLQEVIQGAFPAETHQRIRQERARLGNRTGLLKRVAQQDEQPEEPKGFVHFGIECDACGVYPIVGERYQCQDCEEEIGFDLCGRCHAAREQPMLGSYLFQQKHLPSHRMHRVAPVPTFLHQVMDTHPELSVSTVINMVMSMVDERGDESAGAAQHRSPPPDDDVDLGETNLFDEPEAPQPQEHGTAASGQGGAEVEPLESGFEAGGGAFQHDETGAAAGPLDMTSRLVRTVLAQAEVEQAVGRTGLEEDGAPVQGAPVAAAGAMLEGDGQSREEANGERGDEASEAQPGAGASSRPNAEWVWVNDSSQQAELGMERNVEELADDGPEQVSRLGEVPGVASGEGQSEGAQEGSLVATMGDQGSGHEDCVDRGAEKQDGVAGGSNDALDQGEGSRAGLDIEGRQRGAEEEGHQISVEEGAIATDPHNQAAVGPWSDAGRGRGFTEEWCAAHDHQQRASCEPGLRRSDSYHQLMMASA
ncbi:Zinc finger ZZ-type domain containing protein [Klebsormidium nitens]|uniref:Zinc finger ZZ-type domain containing protein n=1 Tax=Klebsormidium nitens TaxID=105231 RepID=A0A1Y1HYC2_KLENI|nr:Zinc finger ZZ-type domain containing protein [Klebsormidium nitens]|eukprot:GAQ81526.1 Zinc finger ZZ-type domain containing protein [Klebsormidium nitens]